MLVDKDTTFAFQLEGQRRGHAQYHCEPQDLFVDRTTPHASVRRLEVERAAVHFHLTEVRTAPLTFFDVVFMRKDPPLDMAYVFATHLLGLADPAVTLVVNAPRGLREANEKLYALNFPDLIPESLVASERSRLRGFLDAMGGEMIVKPLDGCGGAGVLLVRRDDRNLNALLELSTQDGTRLVMAQRYLPAARQGDKRLIVLDATCKFTRLSARRGRWPFRRERGEQGGAQHCAPRIGSAREESSSPRAADERSARYSPGFPGMRRWRLWR